MNAPEDVRLYEWAEFNVPADLLDRPRSMSPLARRVLTGGRPPVPAEGAKSRAFPKLGSMLLPSFGLRSLPKP
jgi:hypothetical protein